MSVGGPRTIAYIDHADEVGGAEKSLCELITHLDRGRFAPVVIHRPGAQWLRYAEGADAELRPGIPDSDLYDAKRSELDGGAVAGIRRMLAAMAPVAALHREFGAVRPAIVHTNSAKMHLIAGAAARLRRLPVLWHMRDLMTDAGARAWLRRAVRRIRPEVIAISEAVAAQFEGMPCTVRVVPNGIPLDRFAPGPPPQGLREELGLPEGVPVACVVGRLTPWKGHRTLLRAWPTVLKRIPEAHLVIVGEVAFWEDDYADELRSLAEELGIAGSVTWAGFRDDVPDVLRLADLLVLASTDEPFGRVVIEGMAAGLPVVATASGGVPEIVADGETGLLAPPKQPGPMGDAIAEILADRASAEAMGEAGRRRAVERYDVRRVARQVGEIYDELLER
ncbi:MAG: glycosyltransferase family 4 protein [Armatimonadota bacterium]